MARLHAMWSQTMIAEDLLTSIMSLRVTNLSVFAHRRVGFALGGLGIAVMGVLVRVDTLIGLLLGADTLIRSPDGIRPVAPVRID